MYVENVVMFSLVWMPAHGEWTEMTNAQLVAKLVKCENLLKQPLLSTQIKHHTYQCHLQTNNTWIIMRVLLQLHCFSNLFFYSQLVQNFLKSSCDCSGNPSMHFSKFYFFVQDKDLLVLVLVNSSVLFCLVGKGNVLWSYCIPSQSWVISV